MIDVDKISEGIKTIAKTAESVFVDVVANVKNKSEGVEENSKSFEVSSLVDKVGSMAKDIDLKQITSFIETMVSDFIRQQQDFQKTIPVKIKTWSHFKGELPKYESAGASGLDVRAQLSEPMVIEPSQRVLIPTGLSMEIPVEYEIQARPRSGLALKKGLTLVNTPGTIDADYRGEIKMIMINLGAEPVVIEDQERIAQLVICPVIKAEFEWVEELSDTARGEGGFGSTGTK